MNNSKRQFFSQSIQNEDCWRMIVYSDTVNRKAREFLRFRLYGKEGKLLYNEIIPRNNLGLLSKYNYLYETPKNVTKILILGGEQTASSVCRVSWPDCLQELFNEEGKSIDVINLAWPDAGPAHYLEYLSSEGLNFKPDFILVNFVESDFYRNINGKKLSFLGEEVLPGIPCVFPPFKNNERASIFLAIQKNKIWNGKLNSPYCIPSRPWGVFLKDERMDLENDIKALQKEMVNDFILGAWEALDCWINYKKRLNHSFEVDFKNITAHDIKQFDTPEEQKIDEDECINYVKDCFQKILNFKIPVLFLHNFHYYEINSDWELSNKLANLVGENNFVDMRKFINKQNVDESFFKDLYMFPDMTEKWSLKGHAFYAKIVRSAIKQKFFL